MTSYFELPFTCSSPVSLSKQNREHLQTGTSVTNLRENTLVEDPVLTQQEGEEEPKGIRVEVQPAEMTEEAPSVRGEPPPSANIIAVPHNIWE